MSRNALNLNLLNYNMKILQVAFLLLFNYLDSLPKLYIYLLSANKSFQSINQSIQVCPSHIYSVF